MSYLIAVSGKGGVGKTTVASLLISRLISRGSKPVLAVDADPNSCLDAVLGVSVSETVGRVREKVREASSEGAVSGISKQQLFELKIAESLVESDDFDLISMGRPEGPGCYCYANNVLKGVLTELSSHYPYVVLDNEAGLENLSRRIVQKVDLLVMVSDSSHAGLSTLKRLHQLAQEMGIEYGALAVVVNRLRKDSLPDEAVALSKELGVDALVKLPDDDEVREFAESGRSLLDLPVENVVLGEIDTLLDTLSR